MKSLGPPILWVNEGKSRVGGKRGAFFTNESLVNFCIGKVREGCRQDPQSFRPLQVPVLDSSTEVVLSASLLRLRLIFQRCLIGKMRAGVVDPGSHWHFDISVEVAASS